MSAHVKYGHHHSLTQQPSWVILFPFLPQFLFQRHELPDPHRNTLKQTSPLSIALHFLRLSQTNFGLLPRSPDLNLLPVSIPNAIYAPTHTAVIRFWRPFLRPSLLLPGRRPSESGTEYDACGFFLWFGGGGRMWIWRRG